MLQPKPVALKRLIPIEHDLNLAHPPLPSQLPFLHSLDLFLCILLSPISASYAGYINNKKCETLLCLGLRPIVSVVYVFVWTNLEICCNSCALAHFFPFLFLSGEVSKILNKSIDTGIRFNGPHSIVRPAEFAAFLTNPITYCIMPQWKWSFGLLKRPYCLRIWSNLKLIRILLVHWTKGENTS